MIDRAWDMRDTEYPAVRRVMGPERGRLDDDALETLLDEMFPGATPEDVENFMRSLQKFGRQAAPILQKVGPGMLKGAVQGGMVAGPWGALAGALGGGAMGLLGGGGAQPPAPAGAPAAPAMPGLMPAPAAGPAGRPAVPGAASAQLLALLSRPETMQALLSLLMGQAGRATVPVGSRQVPAAAFANAVSELAAEAALASSGPAEAESGYWTDEYGERRCDVANPAERAALLIQDLAEAMATESVEDHQDTAYEEGDAAWEWAPPTLEEDDPFDAYEAALYGEDA